MQKKMMEIRCTKFVVENLRNKIDVGFISNNKDYLKWTSKPSYMSQ